MGCMARLAKACKDRQSGDGIQKEIEICERY
jgi:hypothetical protein